MLKEAKSLNQFYVIGVSYEKADVKTRGKFAFFDHLISSLVIESNLIGIQHLFVISTCNRTEIYFFAEEPDKMYEVYCKQVEGDVETFRQITFQKNGKDALEHLFRVSSGLESQILGDFEILGQIKIAFKKFKKAGSANAHLERFIDTAVRISKQIKNETSLSDGATSVSYAAVQYITHQFQNFKNKKITLFGTGKIGRNTCENLVKQTHNDQITLINRTNEKAVKLSDKLQVNQVNYKFLDKILNDSDIFIVSTGSSKPVIFKEMISTTKPLLLVDLSIPANVDADVKELPNVTLVNVDELSQTINQTLEDRQSQIPKVETIIRLNMWEFEEWLESRKFVPAIEAFRERMEFLAEFEKRKLEKKDIEISEKSLSTSLIQKMTNQFASYVMDSPEGEAEKTINLFNEIFHLELKQERK